jgi:adenylate cyclase
LGGRIFLPVDSPVISTTFAVMILGFFAYSRSHKQSKLLADKLGRFVSPTLLEELTTNPGGQSVKKNQRTELSILSIDLAGFTSMTERSEPEEVSSMLEAFYEIVASTLKSHGGTLDKFMGDGALANFGAPAPLADKEERAATVALKIQEAFGQLGRKLSCSEGKAVGIRCGIATGYVSVGYFGTDENTAYTVVGRTVNLAARLESSAGENEVVVDETTANRLVPRFELTHLEPIELKGLSKKVSPFKLTWPRVRQQPFQS